jgi:hypothetical protein
LRNLHHRVENTGDKRSDQHLTGTPQAQRHQSDDDRHPDLITLWQLQCEKTGSEEGKRESGDSTHVERKTGQPTRGPQPCCRSTGDHHTKKHGLP